MKNSRIAMLLFAFVFAFAVKAHADTECVYDPSSVGGSRANMPFSAPLQHGINLTHWWEDQTDSPISSDDIARIHGFGFDFVRIRLSPVWLEIKDPEQQRKKLSQLRCDIISLMEENLVVILDIHPSPAYQAALSQHPEYLSQRIEHMWAQLQPVLKDLPTWKIYLGLYDEPNVDPSSWWRVQEKILNDLRPMYPEATFVLSSGPLNSFSTLTEKRAYEDKNVIYDFHFFEPRMFTFHGAEWLADNDPDKTTSPISYPFDKTFNYDTSNPDIQKYVSEAWNREAISTLIKNVVAWREHYNSRVACLEFGVYHGHVDDKSRYAWLGDVRGELESFNIPWALWEYRGPFGIIDAQGNFDKGILQTLVLGQH